MLPDVMYLEAYLTFCIQKCEFYHKEILDKPQGLRAWGKWPPLPESVKGIKKQSEKLLQIKGN